MPRKVNDYDAEKSGFTRHVNVGTEDVLYEISCPMAKAPGYTTDWVMQLNLVLPLEVRPLRRVAPLENPNLYAASAAACLYVFEKTQ